MHGLSGLLPGMFLLSLNPGLHNHCIDVNSDWLLLTYAHTLHYVIQLEELAQWNATPVDNRQAARSKGSGESPRPTRNESLGRTSW